MVKEENPVLGDPEQNSRQGCSSVKQGCEAEEPSGELCLNRVEIPSSSSDPSSENKYVVFDSCLNQLLMRCRCLAGNNCNGSIVKLKKFFVGSRVSVKAQCSNGHLFHMWDSQPF